MYNKTLENLEILDNLINNMSAEEKAKEAARKVAGKDYIEK